MSGPWLPQQRRPPARRPPGEGRRVRCVMVQAAVFLFLGGGGGGGGGSNPPTEAARPSPTHNHTRLFAPTQNTQHRKAQPSPAHAHNRSELPNNRTPRSISGTSSGSFLAEPDQVSANQSAARGLQGQKGQVGQPLLDPSSRSMRVRRCTLGTLLGSTVLPLACPPPRVRLLAPTRVGPWPDSAPPFPQAICFWGGGAKIDQRKRGLRHDFVLFPLSPWPHHTTDPFLSCSTFPHSHCRLPVLRL